jgi:hypothetical protein
MTAAAMNPASHDQQAGTVPWRKLARVATRQHRTALLWTGIAVGVVAIALIATGIPLRELAARGGPDWYGTTRASVDFAGVMQALALTLQLAVLLAGMFVGAPLLPHEIENGTAKMAWTQAASRTRWLLAQVLSLAGLLALAAVAVGAAFAWWLSPFPNPLDGAATALSAWSPLRFNLNPVLMAGWVTFAFTLGVLLGAAIRRILPAVAATLVCYGAVLYEVSTSWRMHYLPPLHREQAVQFQPGGYTTGGYWGPHQPVIMSQTLGWPDGRPLSNVEQLQSAAWMRQHHIVMWITYQLSSRYHTFQAIELGWLLIASALLVAAAVFVIRRRPA